LVCECKGERPGNQAEHKATGGSLPVQTAWREYGLLKKGVIGDPRIVRPKGKNSQTSQFVIEEKGNRERTDLYMHGRIQRREIKIKSQNLKQKKGLCRRGRPIPDRTGGGQQTASEGEPRKRGKIVQKGAEGEPSANA